MAEKFWTEKSCADSTPEAAMSVRKGRIGVVTVTYNSAEVLPEFFDSLAAQTFREFTIYVVDNASKDETLRLCAGRPDLPLRILPNETNVGVAEGNNQGIRAALADGCDAVLLLNNDTVFPPELFNQLWVGMEHYGCAMTTPKMYFHSNPRRIWAAGGFFQRGFGYRTQHYGMRQMDDGQFDQVRTVTYTPTCCVLIHKEVFACVGLMDASYFVYVDDADFMYRAHKDGKVLKYLPHAVLWHKVSALTGDMSPFTIRFCTRNRMYFLRKHLSVHQARAWKLLYQSYFTLRLLARRDSISSWKLKQSSAREGWKLYIPTNH